MITNFEKIKQKEQELGWKMESVIGEHPNYMKGAVPGIKIGQMPKSARNLDSFNPTDDSWFGTLPKID